jgi:PPOX class probable F420-dependent enzyme
MDLETAQRRFAQARVARLATVGADGLPHVVPVVFAVGDRRVFLAVDEKPKSTRALRRLDNISANGHSSLLVDEYDDDWTRLWWVRVDGEAAVATADSDDGRRAIDALVAKYPQYAAERPAGPAVIVTSLRWRSWSYS